MCIMNQVHEIVDERMKKKTEIVYLSYSFVSIRLYLRSVYRNFRLKVKKRDLVQLLIDAEAHEVDLDIDNQQYHSINTTQIKRKMTRRVCKTKFK